MVPNQFPKVNVPFYRIAFIGEAPCADEDACGQPFMGASGRLLWSIAAKHGISRDVCFVGNVCQHRPPGNKIELFDWNGPEMTQGRAQLTTDLATYRPNLCVLLGNTPLRMFTAESGISKWRGSLLIGNGGYKCLPTIHPAAVLRTYSNKALLDFDLKKARLEGTHPELHLPERNLYASLSYDEILARLSDLLHRRPVIAIDIEGYWNYITCISIAESPTECFVIPLDCWEESQEKEILRALAAVLVDPKIPKILQNALYDTFCLQYGYRIPVRGVVDDTMLGHWELFCEMPKSLGFLASIYTREPYWKDEREDENRHTRLLYCCKDSAVTYEVRDVLQQQLKGSAHDHYRLNLALLEPLLYMEQKGILYDTKKSKDKKDACVAQINRLQWALNEVAGIKHPTDVDGWIAVARDALCFKKFAAAVKTPQDIITYSKTTTLHLSVQVAALLSKPLTLSSNGELSVLTEHCLNVESIVQMSDFLYRQLCLPIQYKKEKGRKTDRETTDALALLKLYQKVPDPTLKLILRLRALRTRIESLGNKADPDGRIRCGYNLVGTETGRISCYESPTGSGFNLQTATKKDRDLFLPDPGYWMFQCDLSGADGWTVAAHCAAAGDTTMLDDYRYGIKPARNVALSYQVGREVLSYARDQLKAKGKLIDGDGWLYFACKQVQHGSNYGMGAETMSEAILRNSYKYTGSPIHVSPRVCEELQELYFLRYPGIHAWHAKLKQQLRTYGYLVSANGHKRIFFDRRDEHTTFKAACAEEPQNNTTHANNLALFNIWTDPDNRVCVRSKQCFEEITSSSRQRSIVELRIQPLHTVHDAIVGQFKQTETAWAIPKIKQYFNNTLVIAGQRIVIPFEGAYGKSWGDLHEGVI